MGRGLSWARVMTAAVAVQLTGPALAADCRLTTPELEAMHTAELRVSGRDGAVVEFAVKVADDAHERAAGFQHVCPETIRRTPILFVFKRPVMIMFHMQNVRAPLDIGFIDPWGRLAEILPMMIDQAGARRYYRPSGPIRAALEAHAGFFAKHGMSVGHTRIDAWP